MAACTAFVYVAIGFEVEDKNGTYVMLLSVISIIVPGQRQ